MKYVGIVTAVIAALVLAGTATAGNWSDSRLNTAATAVAGHPINVWCEASWSDWVHTGDEFGTDFGLVWGLTAPTTTTVFVNPDVCFSLHLLLSGADVGTVNAAQALLTLAHEASHQAGYWEEADAECHALTKTEDLAVGYFNIRAMVMKPYTAIAKRNVGVRVNGHTVIRSVTTKVIRYHNVRNPWLTRLAGDVQAWHNATPAEYRTAC
jgi:hypothetical protein